MHQNADLAGRHVEQPARLDHLKAFIHQGCRIDGDALAHLPGRVVERLLDRDVGELAGGSVQKRAARGSQPNPLNFRSAESMVMRLPIFQVGWLSACSTVMLANSLAGVCRNGPPEAVSQTR